jgi:hypothetical protein
MERNIDMELFSRFIDSIRTPDNTLVLDTVNDVVHILTDPEIDLNVFWKQF